jgi:hypothetical protein
MDRTNRTNNDAANVRNLVNNIFFILLSAMQTLVQKGCQTRGSKGGEILLQETTCGANYIRWAPSKSN